MQSLQKFASIHACIHNRFNAERYLIERQTDEQRRSATLAEGRNFAAGLRDTMPQPASIRNSRS